MNLDISVVIPTRNRHQSLLRLLRSLNGQLYPLKEVLIIDASDKRPDEALLKGNFPNLNIVCHACQPSVCIQRNKGIRLAASPCIFLSDDDMEYPPHYVATLAGYLEKNPEAGAVSGVWLDAEPGGQPVFRPPAISFKNLLWNFIFQLTVWAEVEAVQPTLFNRIPLGLLKKFYAARKNTFTLAGWPLLSEFGSPVFETAIYSLGASIVRREWLLQAPFDEILDRHGIGDNYGVAINFPRRQGIAVLSGTYALHHKASENRLPYELVYFRRLLALHYFMKKSPRFSALHRGFLLWSLLGSGFSQSIRRKKALASATREAINLIVRGKNPYLAAWREKAGKVIEPQLKYTAKD